MSRRFTRRRPIKPQPNPDAAKAISVILAGIRTQVGEDDSPSPLLDSLVDDIGLDEAGVEVAQDAALLLADIGDAIKDAVASGSVKALPWQLMGLVSTHIPELAADIDALKS